MKAAHEQSTITLGPPPLGEQERNATVAVYDDLAEAEEAVRILEHAGFDMPPVA